METLQRKQVLKKGLIDFIKQTKNTNNLVFNIQTDINKSYWIHNGFLFDSKIFNLKAATKIKANSICKNTVYYISTIAENQINLFNIN
jgi:hypothetical protein